MTDYAEALRYTYQARILHESGQFDLAMEKYRQALFLEPELAIAYRGLAEIHQAQGNLDDAAIYYEQSLLLAPDHGETCYNFGVVLARQGKTDEAMAQYERAIALRPNLSAAYNNLGTLLKSQDRFEEARLQYEQALALEPSSVQVHNNLGQLYHAQGDLDKAILWYRRTLDLAPDYAEAMHNLGDALMDNGNLDAALTQFETALTINPDLHYATYSKTTIQLLRGDFKNGWEGYEARWSTGIAGVPMREYPWPLWTGEKPARGKVLIWADQGTGDEIMFSGLIPDVIRRLGNAFVVDCANERLRPLLQRSFPNIEIIYETDPGNDIVAHLPISSLPRLFRQSEADFAATTPSYLVADPTLVKVFRTRYTASGARRQIGLAWHTVNKRETRFRSIPLEKFASLFAALGPDEVQWINLQYGDPKQLETEIKAAHAPIFIDPTVDQLRDMDWFAAQIAALDLVITIDNTTAHLAGALGVPTWLLLPHMPHWRWQLNRPDSPWYPSLRLFRQPAPGDWDGIIHDLVREYSKR